MAVLKDLIVHGPSRFINTAQFESLKTNKIGAEEGIFNKIVATTGDIGSLTVEDLTAGKATVLSLLDVRGELHTNQWTNSNIATIDGSFYITPTIGVNSGTMTTTANSVTVKGSNFPISSLYVNGINSDNTAGTVAWTNGSKVLITGEILVNGTYMPLGTLVGVLDGDASATQIKIKSITDNRYQTAESLAEIGTQSTALPCRNVKVSLYQTSRGSTLYPLGIFMTALGENGKTFLDIYGGGYATSTATAGGFAKPVLRIGNLAGLPAISGQNPTGYGIYTSNGYFTGTIVSTSGTIGGFTIDSTDLYNGTLGAANSVWMSTGTSGSASIGGSSSINNWAFTASNQFGVTKTGELWANLAHIKGSIDATSFQARDGSGNIRAIVDSNGLTVKDAAGNMVAAFSGSGVSFSSSVSQKIGNNTNYIEFNPTTNRINIIGSGVYFGSTPIDDVATTDNIDTAISTTKAELDATKIDVVGESTSLLDNINAISDQITMLASRINFGNITVADNLAQLNTAVSIDTATSTVYIGDQSSFHVRINGTELGFYQGAQRVAYINNNQLYITQSVVLQQMDLGTKVNDGGLGQWSWKVHANGATPRRNNLNLKWIG